MYLKAEDFKRDGMTKVQKKFFRDFSDLLYNIISPEYVNIYQEDGAQSFDLDFEDEEDNIILVSIDSMINSVPILPNENTNLYDLVDKYCDIKNTSINNIKRKIYPQIKSRYLQESKIEEDHYIFETFDITTKLHVYTFVDTEYKEENYYGNLNSVLSVIIRMRIQKTFNLELENTESENKLSSLCRKINLFSKKELEDWAKRIKIQDYESMEKKDLCSSIRKYYGWKITGNKYLNY